jgi:hypothetical protein
MLLFLTGLERGNFWVKVAGTPTLGFPIPLCMISILSWIVVISVPGTRISDLADLIVLIWRRMGNSVKAFSCFDDF